MGRDQMSTQVSAEFKVPDEYKAMLATWSRNANLYMRAGFVLGGIGTIASLTVSAFADCFSVTWVRAIAFIAAVCTALAANNRLFENANNFWAAWRVLNMAIL